MFSTISEWSYQLMSPLIDVANATKSVPLLFSFLLGIVGTLAPCQLTGNISAITLYGNQSLQKRYAWKHILLFILGKIIAFTTLGLLIWFLGKEIQQILTLYFPWLRKMMGPLLILMGLLLSGIIKGRYFFSIKFIRNQNEVGSFLLGFFFSLAFCPTMFVLFFGTLIPLSLSYTYGYLFPSFFSVGTALPIVIFMFIISYLGLNGALLKKSRKIGKSIQRIAGILLILIGLYDAALYW
ncbi:cytochrome c biosynthesis protein [Bacillus cereus]|uniref:urease accessory protein UreH domain-containing protein n=1 Tax=Bacillus cereus group TaxID=86661 RepID=UPI001EF13742|nr:MULTISPECIES: sulfite exporter TauE/SafE family protein [Bacillus cereus group]MCU5530667.1 sulfite exporter TauE/SafE family protein [Bacillus cereus]MCU5717399.1 sulfite exporter TauE/SafE family protein [Bacillus cereus]MDA1842456.1 sulfite exporter TauE/SafE family protein [Bacillus cereus]MDA2006248.1 sulfite exporter TauE/SafE family protein [Bacillus cereus]MDA2619300.1 sulfite exporter TauE/SafE family protein [Bacillus cereus]